MDQIRSKQVDALKGFAILLVVLGHVTAYSNPDNLNDNLLFNVIYSFHMPLFFFVSGYLTADHMGSNLITWNLKKFRQLVIPYILFTIFYKFMLFKFALLNTSPLEIAKILLSYTIPDSAWFLPVLFESFLILSLFVLLKKVLKNYSFIIYFVILVIITSIPKLWDINLVHQLTIYSPFVILGYLVGSKKIQISQYCRIIGILGIILFLGLSSIKYSELFPKIQNVYIYLIYFYILASTGIAASWFIIQNIIRFRISNLLVFCGKFTMEIYLIHLVLINYFSFRHWPLWIGTDFLAIFTGTIMLLLLSLIISLMLSYNKYISNIIFGRWAIKDISPTKNKPSMNTKPEV